MTHASDLGLTMTPSCSPLSRLSYSEWSRVTSCGWKAAFARDDRSRSLSRGSVASAMGNARHAMEEEVAARERARHSQTTGLAQTRLSEKERANGA